MAAPLAGVTVVALEQAVSAPMCTRALADFGARVIKVENPDGGDFARYYDDVVHGQAAHFVAVVVKTIKHYAISRRFFFERSFIGFIRKQDISFFYLISDMYKGDSFSCYNLCYNSITSCDQIYPFCVFQ